MSDEGRRVFPMETVLGVVADKGGDDVLDLLGYVVNHAVDDDCRPAVAPIAKGWLYSLNPAFMKVGAPDDGNHGIWVAEQRKKLGDNISLPPLPDREMAGVHALIDTVENAKQTAVSKTVEAEQAVAAKEAADAEMQSLLPFKKKAEDLQNQVGKLEEKNSALDAEVAELKGKLASFDGKVAVDEKDIEKSVKDIVSRAVKDALGGLVAAGAGAAAAEGGGEAPAAFEDASSEASSDGGVPDTFGFGSSGSNDDGFGF